MTTLKNITSFSWYFFCVLVLSLVSLLFVPILGWAHIRQLLKIAVKTTDGNVAASRGDIDDTLPRIAQQVTSVTDLDVAHVIRI